MSDQSDKMEIVRSINERGLESERKLKDALQSGKSEVVKIYDGAVLFVTGGSGFVGKQFLEKILRTCNVKKIYLLLRPKKGKTVIQRLNQTLEDPLFDHLRSEQPNFASKLIPVEGDVIRLNLGIDEETRNEIAEEVNMIFHGAATINFGETVRTATLTNIRGTREILTLAKACKQLKSVVHISTAYVQATKSRINDEIKEEFYQSAIPPDALIQLAEELEEEQLERMIKPLMENWPNTYTFTKAVTEELIKQKASDLPLCIVRPAIVISAYREPTPGWIDVSNVYGPSGIILGLSLGVIHTTFADVDIQFDLVPVDIVNNTIIVAAWVTHQRHIAGKRGIKIYFVTSNRNPLYFGDLTSTLKERGKALISPKAIWYCFSIVTKNKLMYLLLTWLLHYIPGYISDATCILIRVKPRFTKIYKKVYSITSVFTFFTNSCWIFRDDNTLGLSNKLNDTDKELFHYDMKHVDKFEMLMTWFYGVSKFIIKDDENQYAYSAKKQWWLKIAHFIFMPLYLYSLYKIAFIVFSYVFYLINFFVL